MPYKDIKAPERRKLCVDGCGDKADGATIQGNQDGLSLPGAKHRQGRRLPGASGKAWPC